MSRYLLLPDQNYLSEWCIQKSESERGKSACVTQGIIIKIDARLRGLFQFWHEAETHTHQLLQLVDTRSMIEIMQSENSLSRWKRASDRRESALVLSLSVSQLIRRRKEREREKEDEA